MPTRSKLMRMKIRNIGCIGDKYLTVALDDVVCLVGQNNAGKSTVLKAYELARSGANQFSTLDRCKWAPEDEPSEVILDIHIPEGISNIDRKWKFKDEDALVVRSKWQWQPSEFKRIRKTWDPEQQEWADDGKAGGADSVFNSRLPMALRIGSLDDAEESEEKLLTFLLTPLVQDLSRKEKDPQSDIFKARESLNDAVNDAAKEYKKLFDDVSEKITDSFSSSFDDLEVNLNINNEKMSFDFKKAMKDSSGLIIQEHNADTLLTQQGTGARRALLWAAIQVYTEVSQEKEKREKIIKDIKKQLEKEKDLIENFQNNLTNLDNNAELPLDENDPALPGCLLLIDEPENALHPLAARAAQQHLYQLAKLPSWQVMITTHSPHFINPFVDHTTIVRLERKKEDRAGTVRPLTYRADTIDFERPTKRRLQALQQLDVSLAEVFFGSYPILVEGDTEHAAFLAAILEPNNNLAQEITIVRARGKALLCPLIRMLRHFKISFSIIHDSDAPYTIAGKSNSMWTENQKIWEEIEECRRQNIEVRHRICIPDFERLLGESERKKDKPLEIYELIKDHDLKIEFVRNLFNDLKSGEQMDPFGSETINSGGYLDVLSDNVRQWATDNGFSEDIRFFGGKVLDSVA